MTEKQAWLIIAEDVASPTRNYGLCEYTSHWRNPLNLPQHLLYRMSEHLVSVMMPRNKDTEQGWWPITYSQYDRASRINACGLLAAMAEDDK